MNNALQMLDNVLPYIIVFLAIALCSTLLAASVYVWSLFHKKIDLKQINAAKEENRQVIEDANMLKFSTRYGEQVNASLKELQELKEQIKKAKGQLADIEKEAKVLNRKK